MKYSKKGVTLVELVICCAILVMLGGACTAVMTSGAQVFNQSTRTASAQIESDVLQTFMMNILPSASNIRLYDNSTMIPEGKYIYLDSTGKKHFIVRSNDKDTSIRSVESFKYAVISAGTNSDARAQFIFKATLDNGKILTGGYVMSNVRFSEVPEEMKLEVVNGEQQYLDIETAPIMLNIPEPEEDS